MMKPWRRWIHKFFLFNMSELDFANLIVPYKDKYSRDMLLEFYYYWTEKNINGKKMRFEKEKTFGLSRRLATWFKNGQKWDKPKHQNAGELLQQKYGL